MTNAPLTLHIGLSKTGTTTLQLNLFKVHPDIHYFGKIPKSRITMHALDEMTYRLLLPILWKVQGPMDTETARSLLQDGVLPGIPENQILLGSWESLSGRSIGNYVEMLDRSQAVFGGCRIMITLRNPLTRLPSVYLQNLRSNFIKNNTSWVGYQSYASIEDWYRKRMARNFLLDYCEFIRIAIEKLGRDNVGVILFENLQHNPSEYYRSICKFIGIDFDIAISLVQDKHYYRQEFIKKGIEPGNPSVLEVGGFNAGQCNAVKEGGEKNGVLTAIEDFMFEHEKNYEFVSFPILFGYGVLIPKCLLNLYPALDNLLFNELHINSRISALLAMTETALICEHIAHHHTRNTISKRPANTKNNPKLSIVVVIYNMVREAPRTIHSLSPEYQLHIDKDEYEVIIVENGSTKPLPKTVVESLPDNFRYIFIPTKSASKSPAFAVNEGLRNATGTLFGIMIDGARIATPGLLSYALKAGKLHERSIVFGNSFMLGSQIQNISVEQGYNQQQEDQLLSSIHWPEDGYRLFEIGVLAGSNAGGWCEANMESNSLFVSKKIWQELEGMDERFDLPGGGFVNPDLYCRACELKNTQLVVIAGEGTFHQFHGGIATNSSTEELQRISKPWLQQYKKIRGKNFTLPIKTAMILGHIPEPAKRHIVSLTKLHFAQQQPVDTKKIFYPPAKQNNWAFVKRLRNLMKLKN